jgi:hypothetical protein
MPGLKRKSLSESDDSHIEESPLLNSERKTEQTSALHSTIHPERFDMSRFSDLREEENESSFRIIIYVLVVIIVGVGLALFVRQLISEDNNSPTETTEDTENDDEEDVQAFRVNTTPKADDQGAPVPSNDELIDSEVLTVGETSVGTAGVTLSTLTYDRYQTFARFNLNLTGTTAGSIPEFNLAYDDSLNTLVITLPEGITVEDELKVSTPINDIVNLVKFDAATNSFSITLAQDSKYRVRKLDAGVSIDFRTQEQIDTLDEAEAEEDTTDEDTEEETPEDEEDTTTDDTDKPTGMHITNDFSQNKQFVTSNVTGNTIEYTETYYQDYGPYFEIAFGKPGSVGDSKIANTTAEYVTEGAKTFIEVKIENLSKFTFPSGGVSTSSMAFDTSAANFRRVDLVSFTGGVATLRIEVKNKANFKLLSEKTVDGGTQVVSVQIND